MKDAGYKADLFRHFWRQRCFVQTEVDVYVRTPTSSANKVITDVDVLALRPGPGFRFSRVIGDCKNKNKESAINRSLWVAGLMRLLSADRAILLLQAPGGIEQDHKLAADEIGVTLLAEKEFAAFDQALVPPLPPGAVAPEPGQLQRIHRLHTTNPKLKELCDFLRFQGIQIIEPGTLIRRAVGHLVGVQKEIDVSKLDHRALIYDSAAMLGVGLAECAGVVFNQFLQPELKENLADALRSLLWGGHDRYKQLNQLRSKIRDGGELLLPEWEEFVQVVRRYLNAPLMGMLVPWILRSLALVASAGPDKPIKSIPITPADGPALSLAIETVDYVLKVLKTPREERQKFRAPLNHLATVLAPMNVVVTTVTKSSAEYAAQNTAVADVATTAPPVSSAAPANAPAAPAPSTTSDPVATNDGATKPTQPKLL